MYLISNSSSVPVDFDFQVFEFLTVDEAVFRSINTDIASMAEISPYLTVDASQLVVSNGNYIDSLHSLQVKSILCIGWCGDLTIFTAASST